ncbi:MAG TPA: helix-turn-helix domain-containing protein [Actinomycetota bacterium]|nr:helix-turn-helix domain-containing protein [Actinomycetota bacterium]
MGDTTRKAYSPNELARLIGVSPGHVRNLIRRGTIPSVRFGVRIAVPAAWLDAYLEGRDWAPMREAAHG